MKITTDWLREYLNHPNNLNLIDSMTSLGLEVESVNKFGKESIIDLDVTPNRSDCLSIFGVARDLSAKYNLKVNDIKVSKLEIKKNSKMINKIEIPSMPTL